MLTTPKMQQIKATVSQIIDDAFTITFTTRQNVSVTVVVSISGDMLSWKYCDDTEHFSTGWSCIADDCVDIYNKKSACVNDLCDISHVAKAH